MRALVTGGGGFLGEAIVRRLLVEGFEVRSLARGDYPALRHLGVDMRRGDLADSVALENACARCDVVFHVAAKAGVWGRHEDYYRTNVIGTQNVVDACLKSGVPKLIHTSSPSVVFDGNDMKGINESALYPSHFEAPYPQTKAEAEKIVLAANGNNLATVALRPHLIWGPGDPHLIPRILARAGRLRVVGDGMNKVDAIYIDDAAEAHLQAARCLEISNKLAGKKYFISQGDPRPLWEIINRILAAGGLPPVRRHVSLSVALALGGTLETIYNLFRISSEPPMTRFVARELATSHWFDISAARRDFDFAPKVSFDEGMRRVEAWLRETGRFQDQP